MSNQDPLEKKATSNASTKPATPDEVIDVEVISENSSHSSSSKNASKKTNSKTSASSTKEEKNKKKGNRRHALAQLLSYMGKHKFEFLAVGILVSISGVANLFGTYMIRPVVNTAADGDTHRLGWLLMITALIYLAGVLSSLGYTQLMAKGAQQIVQEIRHDLFSK
ncbi:MAG: hypothetical protein K2H85_03555, partial [Allobaculum sp.]|nr:hypothetical protein [Allobaculum sp.]